MKDVGLWTISKVVLNHSYPCCPDQAEMLKQHWELSMSCVAPLKPTRKPESDRAKLTNHLWHHRELGFIEKDVRNYIIREVRNIFEEDDAKEFGKYLVIMKEKSQNFFFELNSEGDHYIKYAFWDDARSRAAFDYFGDVVSFDTTYNTNRLVLSNIFLMFSECIYFGSTPCACYLCRYNLVLGSFMGVNHHS
ncbi:hypothetical protein Ahy_A06g029744 [Arachis hypogaea]|uniref:Uncharacterized protein n=1 Tax=Arachis hypogaea TaxID=3818 RepID=A0A445CU56_ARAHY|nr:hypothetical protein Ahy_A06g029744 [Arachis hypogaea]